MDTSSAATNSLTPSFPVIDPAPVARVATDAVRTPPLPEVFRTIRIPEGRNGWRRLLAFLGPGYLVSVGYMDPGNWATDIAGGSKFGYALLSVVLISNLMAILLQSLCVRLGVATGRDLAQACRDYFGRPTGIALWILCEIAIVACDLAELLGSALALNLLFGIPMAIGVCLTTLDVLVLLWLQNKGFRYTEAIVVTLVATIAVCFALQVVMSQPAWGALAIGLVPTPQILANPEMLYIAMGILGATVMPHNLYLHSAIVQTRAWGASETAKRQAIKFGTIDSTAALSIAFFINAAIMVVAAAVFNRAGRFDVADIRDAYQLMSPLLGVAGASTLFAVALLASGQASTLTATLAGQIVMEGFLHIRLVAWLRRLITRLLALIPALITIVWFGEESTGSLLVGSQVVLSLQLSFAVIPLVMFTSNAKLMGAFVAPRWLVSVSWVVAISIAALNAWLLVQILF